MHFPVRHLVLVLLCGAAAMPAAAQSSDPVESARVQLGPLGITPAVGITNLGVDSNVFNQPDAGERDTTMTSSVGGNAWLRARRSLLSLDGRADFVYFRQHASERSVDGNAGGVFEVRGNHFTPWVGGRFAAGRQRLGYEIDARSRRQESRVSAGLDLRLGAKSKLTVAGERRDQRYDADAQFLGTSLQQALNHRTDARWVAFSHSLTPLTAWVTKAELIQDRFGFSPDRDADSVRVVSGFDLQPSALIAGTGRIGYRRFRGSAGVPEYAGLVGSVDASYTLLNRTRFDVEAQRDLEYSFDVAQPYYVISGGRFTVTPQVTRRLDVQARAAVQRLAYRELASAGTLARVDRYTLYGAGVGIRLAGMRVGVNLDRERRESPLAGHEYDAYRMGMSITYGR
jgi:hypothetical protein